MIKFGNITERDADKCLVRVELDGDDIVTDWLPVMVSKSKEDKAYSLPDAGDHVVCLMDESCEAGVVLGSIYDEGNAPGSVKGADVSGIVYKDGTVIQYDREAHEWKIVNNTTTLLLSRSGFTIKRGSESVKKIFSDLMDEIIKITVPTGTGPSGVPVNAAAFTAIKTRLDNLFID